MIHRLWIENLRCFKRIDIQTGPGIHLISGDNGTGKTTLLESIYLLGRGRSFRHGSSQPLIQRGQSFAQLGVELSIAGRSHILGLKRSGSNWQARLDGQNIRNRSQLFRLLPTLFIGPDSLDLIQGPSEQRRHYLDWLLFYIEPNYHYWLNHYQRSLKQRNQALKQSQLKMAHLFLEPMIQSGQLIDQARQKILPRIQTKLDHFFAQIRLNMPIQLKLRSGWSGDLKQCILEQIKIDLEQGYTHRGPHRADLVIQNSQGAIKHRLSRGQIKMISHALWLSARAILAEKGIDTVILIDELASEWGRNYQQKMIDYLAQIDATIWITALDPQPFQTKAQRILNLNKS